MESTHIQKVRKLLKAYDKGLLGKTTMPEDTHPKFKNIELKRIYYTLPMALNYQRNSYKLWEAARDTFQDNITKKVFLLDKVIRLSQDQLRKCLLKYKLALQPNKHIDTWSRVSKAIFENYGSVTQLIVENDSDYLKIREHIQHRLKSSFPYLSGPKIFNYWMFIMSEYGNVKLKNRSHIEIAPDTHIIQASVKLGVLSQQEASKMSRESISEIWRELLKGSNIDPIDVHSPLWLWSRSGFQYPVSSQ